MNTSVVDVEGLKGRVDTALERLLDEQRRVMGEVDPAAGELVDSLRDLMTGGKRLRPAFCYWGWRGAGGDANTPAPVEAAAALELFQVAALVHDDVIDESDTRRGRPTVHRSFARRHREGAWHGDPDRFGLATAVLTGDLCLAWSNEVFTRAADGVPAAAWRAARGVYDLMSAQLMAGQYLDVHEQAEAQGTVERALHVIRYKSAKYTVEHPLLVGGALAGAASDVLAAYSAYALPLGEAFQLRDDLLGVFGDPQRTGKPSGDDLREGKRTVLVALATAATDDAGRRALTECLLATDPTPAQIHRARDVLRDSGAEAEVERMIAARVEQATAALEDGPVAAEAAEVLRQLIGIATARAA